MTHVIMPNHLHLLLEIDSLDLPAASTSLSNIVKGLKATVTKSAREFGLEGKIWQNSFHDHIVRDETDLVTHYEYIIHNVDRWFEDVYCKFN